MGRLDTGWRIEDALLFIREHNPQMEPLGFYLALAGGVLNYGQSNNDLDILVMLRREGICSGANPGEVIKYFLAFGTLTMVKFSEGPHYIRYKIKHIETGRLIDLIFHNYSFNN